MGKLNLFTLNMFDNFILNIEQFV